MHKLFVVLVSAVAFFGLAAGLGCEKEQPVVNICKDRSQTSCEGDDRCYWKEKDDGTFVCKPKV